MSRLVQYIVHDPGVLRINVPINILEEGEHRNTSSSYSTLLSTLIPLLIISVPLLLTFLFLRVKIRRVYAPRTFIETLHDDEKTPKLEKPGLLNWMPEFWHRPDEEILDHQNLDGYLFIRFMKTITIICFVGFCLTLPVMITNYMGGGNKSELESLTLSNVTQPDWYYCHASIAALFFGYVMYKITTETIYYINLRYAFCLTPKNATRVSNRVVLFTSVPPDWRNEDWLRGEFDQIERVWAATDCKELEKLVQERDTTAFKLEDAEIELLRTAITKSKKSNRHFEGADATSRYVSSHDRPKTRSIPFIRKREDTIKSSSNKLQELIPKTKQQQQQHLHSGAKTLPAVIIQFETQRAAQAAFQTSYQYQPGNMEPRSINILPDDIIWKNLGITRWSRISRTILSHSIVVLLILFWSIPVGLVGTLADVDSLVDDLPFLSFINEIPVAALGAITGLLPALLISALLALVPIICRFLATQSGAVTNAQAELQTQSWYFAFQVVQVFLITTFSSGASSVAKQIFYDPTKATSLLAENLPRASNFYLSYFMLQGITVAASQVFQIVPLLIFTVVSKFLDKTPRAKYNRWIALSTISWGDTYPKITNLAVIALAYSCIAPLTLLFAAIGLGLLYLAFRYNIFYALTVAADTKGDAYGLALQNLTVGIYLAELSLTGLFAANGAQGPMQLIVLLFIITVIYQLYLNWVLDPLLNSISDKLLVGEEEEVLAATRMENGESSPPSEPRISSFINNNLSTIQGRRKNRWSLHRERGGYFAPYLFHGTKSSYPQLRTQLSSSFPGQPAPTIPSEIEEIAYFHPAITAAVPTLWITKDELGISKEQIKELKWVIDVVDRGAEFDEKGNVVWDQENLRDAPIWKDRVDL